MAACDNEPANTDPVVSGVSVSGNAIVEKGGTAQFTATVSGSNSPATTVTWSIVEAGKNSGTVIDATGKLTVASAESLSSLTVKATSTADTSKSGTFVVTVYAAGTMSTVTNVTVSASTSIVEKGGTVQFTATVTGTNNPPQTVTWSFVGSKHAQTAIDDDGKLTLASAENNASLTVKATSTVDVSRSGTATVSVSGGGGNENLPPTSGANELSGKTYYEGGYNREIITFAANGNYARRSVAGGTYNPGVRFTYVDIETGTYSWNQAAKSVTLKPEKINIPSGSGGPIDPSPEPVNPGDGTVIIDDFSVQLGDKNAARQVLQAAIQAWIDYWMNEEGYSQAQINQMLAEEGFASVDAYFNAMLDERFANKTFAYSISADGRALFFEEALEAGRGVNELSGQTYYGVFSTWDSDLQAIIKNKNEDWAYVFTASAYTFTDASGQYATVTGSYSYDSTDSEYKGVNMRPSTIDGKDRAAYYAEKTAYIAYTSHHYADEYAARAAETNDVFRIQWSSYDSVNKTIEGARRIERLPPIPMVFQGYYKVSGYWNPSTNTLMSWDSLAGLLGFETLIQFVPENTRVGQNYLQATGGLYNGQSFPGRIDGNTLYASSEDGEFALGTFDTKGFHWTYMLQVPGAYVLYERESW
jgi:hypothetical protein